MQPRPFPAGGERAGDPTRRVAWLSLGVGIAVFAAKLAAWGLTGSAAIFSDAMESVVNVAASAMLVVSVALSARPADADHPYGHGKIEYFSAGIEGTLIVVAAGLIALEAGQRLLAGEPPRRLGLGAAVVLATGVANGAMGAWLVRLGRRSRSPALLADGRHLLVDVWTSSGVLLGLGAVRLTGWAPLDPLIALGIAAHILREGYRLARGAVRGLMDEADEALLAEISATLEGAREPSWIDVHGLRAWQGGPALHADLHLVVPRFFDADQLHSLHEMVERVLLEPHGGLGDVIVHFDPCRTVHCSGCALPDCPVRAQPLVSRPVLEVTRTTRTDPEAGEWWGAEAKARSAGSALPPSPLPEGTQAPTGSRR